MNPKGLQDENDTLRRMVGYLSEGLAVAERRNDNNAKVEQQVRSNRTLVAGSFATFMAVASAAVYLGAESFQDNATLRLQTECEQMSEWLTDDKSDNQMTVEQIEEMNERALKFVGGHCSVGRP